MQDVYDRLTRILTTRLRVPEDSLHPQVSYADLELDSLALVELLSTFEDELGAHVGEEEINADFTLSQTVELLESKGART